MALAPDPGVGERMGHHGERPPSPSLQVVAVKFDDIELQTRELDIDTITKIARQNATTWAIVIDAPTTDLSVARDVIAAAARQLGFDPPPLNNGKDGIAAIVDHFVLVDDDLPEMPEVAQQGRENPTSASETDG